MPSLVVGVEVNEIYYYRGERILNLVEDLGSPRLHLPSWLTKEFAADIFYIFYLPFPKIINNNELSNILKFMVMNPMVWRVKPLTVADREASMVASVSFIYTLLRELGSSNVDLKNLILKNEKRKKDEIIKRAVSQALQKAGTAVKTIHGIKQFLAKSGVGSGSGLEFGEFLKDIVELSKRTDINNVFRLINSIRISKIYGRNYVRSTRGWITGLEIGGDIERVHYSRLAFPEDLFLVELTNSRMLLYSKELSGDPGSFYVLLDKSGSMGGEKIDWARATALALLLKSRSMGMKYFIRFFDSIPHDLIALTPRSKYYDIIKLIKYLASVRPGGGTDITKALAKAVDDIISKNIKGTNNIIIITDGEDNLSPSILKGIIGRCNVSLNVIMVQGSNDSLKRIAHRYFSIKKFDKENIIKVIED